MSVQRNDPSVRSFIQVQSIPESPVDWAQVTSPSVGAGQRLVVNVKNIPVDKTLSLWNFLFSIRIDTDDDDHLYPSGASLTSAQKSIDLQQWIDFATSSDDNNQRSHQIVIINNDASAHVYHILYKAYTFVTASGGIS